MVPLIDFLVMLIESHHSNLSSRITKEKLNKNGWKNIWEEDKNIHGVYNIAFKPPFYTDF